MSTNGADVQDSQSAPSRDVSRTRRGIAIAVTAVMVGLALFIAVAGSSPRACALCHAPQSDALAAGSHASEPCYDCHVENGAWGLVDQKVEEWTRMYPAALLGRGVDGPAVAVGRGACLECHGSSLTRVTESNGLRIVHGSCARDAACDVCHSTVAHSEAVRWASGPVMDECIACHEAQGAPTECDTCHQGEGAREVSSNGPWQVTHGPEWEQTHGMGDQDTCVSCHPSDFCAKCHGVAVPHPIDFGATHGDAAVDDTGACLVCHKSQETFCNRCHGMEMPHPGEFLEAHVTFAEGTSDPRCIRCHVQSDCSACHSLHVHPGGAKGVPVPWTGTPEEWRP